MEGQVVRVAEQGSAITRADYKVEVDIEKYQAVRDHHERRGSVLVDQCRVDSLGKITLYFREGN